MIKRRNKERTSDLILQTTAKSLLERGIEHSGINVIAKQGGFNKVLIYRYFGSWNGIIEALYIQILADIQTRCQPLTALQTNGQPADQPGSTTYLLEYNRELTDNPVFVVLIRWQINQQETELGQRLKNLQEQFTQQMAGSIDALQSTTLRLLMGGLNYGALTAGNQPAGQVSQTEQVIRQLLNVAIE